MTRDEILQMEAGSELDALVAELVMEFVDLGPLQIEDLRWQKPTVDGVVILGRLPHYSTDIAAAQEMEEQILKRGLEYQYGGHLYVLLGYFPFDTSAIWNAAHASPLLRCRAALLCK